MKFSIKHIAFTLLAVAVGCLAAEAQAYVGEFLGLAGTGAMLGAVVNFATVDGTSEDLGNPGGARRVLIGRARSLVGPWPKTAIIDGTLTVTALPTYKVAGFKWAEYLFTDGTASYDFDSNGDPGHQSYKHLVELAMAGRIAALRTEMAKHLNKGVIIIIEDKAGDFVVLGSTDDAIYLKKTFKGGKKGNDKRGYTLKGDVDGLMWEPPVLQASLVATLPIDPFVEPA